MTLQEQIEKFGTEFATIPVNNIRYWNELEMYIGEVVIGCEAHPVKSTIGFEFYEELSPGLTVAYKPLDCYRNE